MMDVQTRTQHDDDDDDTLFVNRDHRAETDDVAHGALAGS
jgi:hypothetical protein